MALIIFENQLREGLRHLLNIEETEYVLRFALNRISIVQAEALNFGVDLTYWEAFELVIATFSSTQGLML